MKRHWTGLTVGGLLMALAFAGCAVTRAGYETAPYRVLTQEGRFEVREYPTLRLAETPMTSEDDSFQRLFRYISGRNEAKQKIPMTTPVYIADASSNSVGTMAFVLPNKMTGGPAPDDAEVLLRVTLPETFAVLRFKGSRQGPHDAAARELTSWMATQQLPAYGEPIFAYFDPPWIPGILRRNEVMIRTASGSMPQHNHRF